jgi:hypothetical protein
MKIYTLFASIVIFFIHTAKSFDDQLTFPSATEFTCSCDHTDMLSKFCNPIKFTDNGMRCFFKHVFNDKEYPSYLAHSLSHMIQFLRYGKHKGQSPVYMQSTLRLFHNRLKSTYYITINSAMTTVEDLLPLVENYFIEEPSTLFGSLKTNVKQILYDNFLSNFNFFKAEPDNFFNSISNEIIEKLHLDISTQAIDKEQFRQTIVRFLEHSLSKLIWCPHDQDDIWDSFKALSEKLACYMDAGIIYEDDLDDLYQTLIERFSYFLRLSGSELSLSLTEKMRNDIDSGNLFIFQVEEQESQIKSKADRLKDILWEVDAKIIARQRGIITEVLAAR